VEGAFKSETPLIDSFHTVHQRAEDTLQTDGRTDGHLTVSVTAAVVAVSSMILAVRPFLPLP
jgi:hypothetical protein